MMRSAELERVISVLRQRRKAALASGIEFVGIVGSLARGEEKEDSDVDVVVRHVGTTTLFRLGRLEEELELEIGRSVDLVFSEQMRPERRAYLERDLIVL
ncbi:MAG: hypothetical protein JWM33_2713 [Caulobacteraceae bacterium]|nr:hypothetical protein [Caulobacteraceae bacterium]